MADWDERCLQDALAQQHKMPSYLPVLTQYNTDWDVGVSSLFFLLNMQQSRSNFYLA